jgi:hypothetical protein
LACQLAENKAISAYMLTKSPAFRIAESQKHEIGYNHTDTTDTTDTIDILQKSGRVAEVLKIA